MNHFRADPKPGSSVREFVMGTVWVDFQAQDATIEIKRTFESLAQQSNVMDSMEKDSACVK